MKHWTVFGNYTTLKEIIQIIKRQHLKCYLIINNYLLLILIHFYNENTLILLLGVAITI